MVTDWSVDAPDWGHFLCAIWNECWAHDFGLVFGNQFENLASMLLGYGPQICVSAELCGKSVAVEHDGAVYSCDHFVHPAHRLGQMQQQHLGDLVFGDRQRAFGFAKRDTLPGKCRRCPHLRLCWGDCPKHRLLAVPEGEGALAYVCFGFEAYFAHAAMVLPALERRVGLSA